MQKIKLGIMGTADIAFRRFLPSLSQLDCFEYVGVASRTIEKTEKFVAQFGGKGYESYEALLQDESIQAIYIPLPPSLHYEWAKKALECGKHILLEKPFTIAKHQTDELIELAREKQVAVFENYMFLYHSQLKEIEKRIREEVGQVRGYHISFGFPMRGKDDFRYKKALGGGALLDCGGYTVRLASRLLGESAKVMCSKLNYTDEFDVDIYGTATLQNAEGIVAQVSFGMDNTYKCELEVWGNNESLVATRIFTAGIGFEPELIVKKSNDTENIYMSSDDQFGNAIQAFYKCIEDQQYREIIMREIAKQAEQVQIIIENN